MGDANGGRDRVGRLLRLFDSSDLLDTAMPVFRDELFAENSRSRHKTSPNLRKSRFFLVFLIVGFENNSPGIRTNVLPGLSVSVKSLTQSARVLFFCDFAHIRFEKCTPISQTRIGDSNCFRVALSFEFRGPWVRTTLGFPGITGVTDSHAACDCKSICLRSMHACIAVTPRSTPCVVLR
jgi:hypothetical protein